MTALTLSPAERALIETIRSGEAFGISIMRAETDGEIIVTTTRDFADSGSARAMFGATFDECWRDQRSLSDLTLMLSTPN